MVDGWLPGVCQEVVSFYDQGKQRVFYLFPPAQDLSVLFYPSPYCGFTRLARTVCWEESVLELWARDGALEEAALDGLTLHQVVKAVNSRNTSGLLMVERDLVATLGDRRYNSSGALVSAGLATLTFMGQVRP